MRSTKLTSSTIVLPPQGVFSAGMIAIFAVATAQECSVAPTGETHLYGTQNCPCLVVPDSWDGELWEYRTEGGFGGAAPPILNAHGVMLHDDGNGHFVDGVEQPYGYTCGTHDWGSDSWCNNMTDPEQLNSWCSSTWCYVGASRQSLSHRSTRTRVSNSQLRSPGTPQMERTATWLMHFQATSRIKSCTTPTRHAQARTRLAITMPE